MIMDIREGAKASSREGLSPSETLSLVSICLDAESTAALRQFVGSTPFIRLQTELRNYLGEEDPRLDTLREAEPDICLIDFDEDRRSAVLTAEAIHESLPSASIFAVSSNAEPDLIIQAMRCGCSEHVLKPLDRDQLLEAVARVGGRKREKRELLTGEILTFLGAKGGAGVTTVATHLGTLLAKSCSRKAILIDLHPSFGDSALYLGLTKHQYHFYELLEGVDRLDADLLQSFVLHHPSGLDVLPAPDRSDLDRHVSREAIGQAIDFIRLRYEFVLIDCPPGISHESLALIPRSNQLYIVMVPEVPAVRNVLHYLDHLGRIEFPQDRIRVILNRHVKRGTLTDEEIEKAIRRRIYWKVPNQYNQVIRTIHHGDPSSQLSNSEVARSVMGWADAVGGKPDPNAQKKKAGRGLLGLLGK